MPGSSLLPMAIVLPEAWMDRVLANTHFADALERSSRNELKRRRDSPGWEIPKLEAGIGGIAESVGGAGS